MRKMKCRLHRMWFLDCSDIYRYENGNVTIRRFYPKRTYHLPMTIRERRKKRDKLIDSVIEEYDRE